MNAMETCGFTKYYGKACEIEDVYLAVELALSVIGIAAAFLKYRRKDIA